MPSRIVAKVLDKKDLIIKKFIRDSRICAYVEDDEIMIVGRYGTNKTALKKELKKVREGLK